MSEAGEPAWKKIALSLERPYKGLRTLEDITADGQLIYEQPEEPLKALGLKLHQIIAERGIDFFEKTEKSLTPLPPLKADAVSEPSSLPGDISQTEDERQKLMTTEETFKMRMEIAPQLFIAMGEMNQARDLLSALLSTRPQTFDPITNPIQTIQPIESSDSPSLINATTISKPPGIPSVDAFNAQLTLGSKDEALRKAANTFKLAADSMERGRVKSEKYWTDALKARRMNWSLVPAPLAFGAPTGKGADRTSKDFLISFGLEESPIAFRRKALAHLADQGDKEIDIVFPLRQRTRLCISLRRAGPDGVKESHNFMPPLADAGIEDGLRTAQQEIIEQEIFSVLVKEAGYLPTAATRVSERLIVIEAAQMIELSFELVDPASVKRSEDADEGFCDLILSSLYALLLRQHQHRKITRLGTVGVLHTNPAPFSAAQPPPILRPIIDLIQYQTFCSRLQNHLNELCLALTDAQIPCRLRFDPVGDIGRVLVNYLSSEGNITLSGEAVLRADHRYVMRLSLASPSTLIIHLPQVTQTITSMPQLHQLIADEFERYLLTRICELGKAFTQDSIGAWFVDLVNSRCIGKLEGQLVNFSVSYQSGVLRVPVFRMSRDTRKETLFETYSSQSRQGLFDWVNSIAHKISSRSSDIM